MLQLRDMPKGEAIGYGATLKAERDLRSRSSALGYATASAPHEFELRQLMSGWAACAARSSGACRWISWLST